MTNFERHLSWVLKREEINQLIDTKYFAYIHRDYFVRQYSNYIEYQDH